MGLTQRMSKLTVAATDDGQRRCWCGHDQRWQQGPGCERQRQRDQRVIDGHTAKQAATR